MKTEVALGVSKKSDLVLLQDATHYNNSMNENTNFLAEDTVARVELSIVNTGKFRIALDAPISENRIPNIKVWRAVVEGDVTALGGLVEIAANVPGLSVEESIAIVHSAGMDERKKGSKGPQSFTVKKGMLQHSAFLTARGDAVAHAWYCTKDLVNFTNRIYPDGDTLAHITIPNLEKGVDYAFFHRPIRAKEVTVWEGPIFLTIT